MNQKARFEKVKKRDSHLDFLILDAVLRLVELLLKRQARDAVGTVRHQQHRELELSNCLASNTVIFCQYRVLTKPSQIYLMCGPFNSDPDETFHKNGRKMANFNKKKLTLS